MDERKRNMPIAGCFQFLFPPLLSILKLIIDSGGGGGGSITTHM